MTKRGLLFLLVIVLMLAVAVALAPSIVDNGASSGNSGDGGGAYYNGQYVDSCPQGMHENPWTAVCE
jgi:hypothetical protein